MVGGSIAALVAADALAAQGEDVRLLLPERGIGGGFAPIRRDGRELELGVRLLELTYEGVPEQIPPLRDYQPGIGGHRPYAHLIESWIRELLGEALVEVERPRMIFDDRLVDDLYFTTDARVLRGALSSNERELIAAEALAAAVAADSGAGVLDPARAAELATLSTAEASRRNHGLRFHQRFVAPLADKIVTDGAERVLAAYRRKIWVPLFWPVTVAQACGEGDVDFSPSRPFHTVSSNAGGGLLEALQRRLRSRGVRTEVAGRLESLARCGGSVEMSFSGGGLFVAEQPIIGPAPGEVFASAGATYAPEQARSVICWVEAEPEDLSWTPSLLNIVDPEIPALRVSSGGRGAPGTQLLTIELRHDLPEREIASAAVSSLIRTGVVGADAELHVVMSAAAPTFAVPTQKTFEDFARAQDAVATLEIDAEIVGGAAGFAADALGEQIIQGLRAAEVVSS